MAVLDRGAPIVIYRWCLFALVTPFVIARLYVQLRFRYKPWREIFVIAGYLLYLGNQVDNSIMNDGDWFNSHRNEMYATRPDEALYPTLKARYSTDIFYMQILYACKAALLCFYMDIAPRHCFPKTWWAIVFTWVFVVIASLNDFFYNLLGCGLPIAKNNWVWSARKNPCSNIQIQWTPLVVVLHVFTDLLVFVIPFVILRALTNVTKQEKRGAYALFVLAFFNILSAFSMLVYNLAVDDWFGKNWSADDWKGFLRAFFFLLPFQAASAMIIVCLPYCRRLVKGMKAEDLRPELNPEALAKWRSNSGATSDTEAGIHKVMSVETGREKSSEKGTQVDN